MYNTVQAIAHRQCFQSQNFIIDRCWLCICTIAITFLVLWRATFLWLTSALCWVSYDQLSPIAACWYPVHFKASEPKAFQLNVPECTILFLCSPHEEDSPVPVMIARRTQPLHTCFQSTKTLRRRSLSPDNLTYWILIFQDLFWREVVSCYYKVKDLPSPYHQPQKFNPPSRHTGRAVNHTRASHRSVASYP